MAYSMTVKSARASGHGVVREVVSHRAVATLDELEDRLYNEIGGVHGERYEPLATTIEDLLLRIDSGEESGGTVGPLPDGTMIQVRMLESEPLIITVTAPDGTKRPFGTQEQAIAYIREQDPDRTQKWILTVSGNTEPPHVWRHP